MSKYINIFLFSFFGVLSIKYNMALTFYIPFVCYYVYKNIKNIFIIVPSSFLSMILFKIDFYINFTILYVFLIIVCLLLKNKNKYIFILFSLISNIIIYYIFKITTNLSTNILYDLLAIIIAPIVLMFLIYNNETSCDIEKGIKSIAYNEVVLAIIITMGAIDFNINKISISLSLSIYFAMYLSSNKYYFSSIFYSFIMMFTLNYYFELNYTLIIPVISFLYFVPNIFSTVVLLLFLIYIIIFEKGLLPEEIYYLLGIISLIFEILRPFNINKKNKVEIINNAYESTMNQIDSEVESFSLFLDKISKNISSNEYNEELGEAIGKLSYSVCSTCEKRSECYNKNKGKIYYYLKNCLLNNTDNFICSKNDEMKRKARQLSNSILDKSIYANDLLLPILNSVSNILRQYTVDHTLNSELDYNVLYNMKEGLEDYGYTISYFNIIKSFKDNFIIEIGMIGIVFFDEKKHIENVISHYLKIETTVTFKEVKNNKTYMVAIPKNNYEIIYGYGSLSKVGNNICGDNYLVKNINNKKMIAVICDGMGKGINANILSSRILKLLDELTNTNITSATLLHILNSFYYIQDYQEKYSTLDYVEIDRHSGEMFIYKAGATYTYIVHESGQMEKIENENLPFGLNEMITSKNVKLTDNDLVIMASDGIFDNIISIASFENFIKSIKTLDPQKISYELLNYARNENLVTKDDMSIIALKIKSAM